MHTLTVAIPHMPAGQYSVRIGTGLLREAYLLLESECAGRTAFVVTDANVVAAGHLQTLIGDRDVGSFVIDPPGEPSKNMQTIAAILEAMEDASLGRDTVIVALGGGTVGDIAGFAASVFKRGVAVVQVPTTTVSQADSAIGGKTGVDSSLSKNAFGTFWHPAAVYIDVAVLATLDDLQYRAGLVESVKHGLIADRGYFEYFEANIDAILRRDLTVLERVALANCRIKAAVVAEDPTEKNKRRILNYGHTIGHAVESASDYTLLHGQAVAIGIVAAGLIEQRMGLSRDGRLERIRALLGRLQMPLTIPPQCRREDILAAMARDKKAVSGRPKFVLLDEIGSTLCRNGQFAHDVPPAIIDKTIEELSR